MAADDRENRVLVLMPSARDAERTVRFLAAAGIPCTICETLEALCLEIKAGAGAALLTEEAVRRDPSGCLRTALREEPAWSAFPLVLLTQEQRDGSRPPLGEATPNVTLVERPVRVRTLLSVVRAALRARQHQYEMRDALARLERGEARLGLAMSIARLGTFEIDLTTGAMWVNDRGREIFGWPKDLAMTYARAQECFHPDDRARVVQRVADAMVPGVPGEFDVESRIIRTDGEPRWIRVRGLMMFERRGDGVLAGRCIGTCIDTTDAREAEARLRASEERFRTLVSQVKDYAIFSTDREGRAMTWNEGVQRVLGYSQEEFAGLPATELFTPEDRAAGVPERELSEAATVGAANDDRWLMKKNGTRFWAMGITTALRNGSGRVVGFTKVMRDQTDWKLARDELALHRDQLDALVRRRTAELEESYSRLRLSERMASIGTLSAGLGHDMGNLLMPMRMRIEALESEVESDAAKGDLEAIRTAAEYLRRLSIGLRMLAQDPDRSGGPGEVDVHRWWAEAALVLKNALPAGVSLQAELDPGVRRLGLSPEGLTQVVFNLVQNAGDALRPRGKGHVWIRCFADAAVGNGSVDGGDPGMARFEVQDDGPGMSEEVRRRCLEPFFSTKPRGISTGMGLSFVHGIVQEAGGSVEVESGPGQGTTFTLRIPVVG